MRLLVCFVLGVLVAAAFVLARPGQAKGNGKEFAKTTGDAARGKTIYKEYCAICHSSQSREQKIGPGLKGLYRRGKFSAGKQVDDSSLRAWIVKGGKNMPSFGGQLTAEQVSDLIAYIRTL